MRESEYILVADLVRVRMVIGILGQMVGHAQKRRTLKMRHQLSLMEFQMYKQVEKQHRGRY